MNNKYHRAKLLAKLSVYLWVLIGPLNLILVYISRSMDKALLAVTNEDIESHNQIMRHTRFAIAINIAVLVAGLVIGIMAVFVLGPIANKSSNI